MWELVVRNTNLYALNYLDALTKEDHARPWTAVTISELTTFLGCLIYMDIQDLPRLEMYWSKKEFYLQSNIASVFTLVRWVKCSHFLISRIFIDCCYTDSNKSYGSCMFLTLTPRFNTVRKDMTS